MMVIFLLFCQCLLQVAVSQQPGSCVNLSSTATPTNGDVIVGSSPVNSTGIVHIYVGGVWGTVCYNDAFDNASDTICTQLGYRGATSHTGVPLEQSSECPVLLSDIVCTDDELHLLSCKYDHDNSGACTTVASITCDTSEPDAYVGQLRLWNGTLPSQGLLQVYLNDQWGTVCSKFFNDTVADIACLQLGYTNAISHKEYTWNDSLSWVHGINCPSNTSCFTACFEAPAIRNIYCSNKQNVFLSCTYDQSEADALVDANCEIEIIRVHDGIIIVLLIIFCMIVLTYITIFVARFIIAAWHKSDRYKQNATARRYEFKNTYTKTLSRNSITPDGTTVFST